MIPLEIYSVTPQIWILSFRPTEGRAGIQRSLDSRFRGNDNPCKITVCETVKYNLIWI